MTLVPKTRSQRLTRGKVTFRSGFIVVPEFSASGGVSYDRETIREEDVDQGLEAELRTIKRVDNREIVKESKSLLNHAHYVLAKNATHTPIGYFADAEALAKIEVEMRELRECAQQLNAVAHAAGSSRRVTVEVYPLVLDLEHEAAARRIAATVRERLSSLRDAMLKCDRKAFESAWDDCRNLERLAVGIQGQAVKLALDHAKQVKGEVLQALREGAGTPEEIAKLIDPGPLDAAIALFEPVEEESAVAQEATA